MSVASEERSEVRKRKLKKNIISLIVARCIQGRADVPTPQREHLAVIEDEIDMRLSEGNVSDTHVCLLASKLRKLIMEDVARSESAPPPQLASNEYACIVITYTRLPPIEASTPSHPSSTPRSVGTPMCYMVWWEKKKKTTDIKNQTSTLLRRDNLIHKSTKPSVVKRREMLISDAPWHKVIADDMSVYTKELRNCKEDRKQKMVLCKASLDNQVQLNRELRKVARNDELEYAKEETRRREDWQKEESEKAAKKRAVLVQDKVARLSKLEEERQVKKKREFANKQEELEYRRRLEQEEEDQARTDVERKMANTKEYREFMEFNKSELERKRRAQEVERSKDKEILKEHAKLLEKQEKGREVILKRAEKKMPGNDYFYELHASRLRKMVEDDARVEEEVRKSDERVVAEERRRHQTAVLKRREFITTLEEQLKYKRTQQQRVKQEEREFRLTQEKEIQNSIDVEQAALHEKRLAAKSHLLELDKQIEEKHIRNMGTLQVGIART